VALTYDQASGSAILYLNGVAVASRYLGSFTPLTSSDLYLGYRPGYGSFRGMLDEVSIYNRALADTEIQAVYNAGASGKCE
jgi:hypothetical protein